MLIIIYCISKNVVIPIYNSNILYIILESMRCIVNRLFHQSSVFWAGRSIEAVEEGQRRHFAGVAEDQFRDRMWASELFYG